MTLGTRCLGAFALTLLLTGCPLTDHYELMSDPTATAGTSNAGAGASGEAALMAGGAGATAGTGANAGTGATAGTGANAGTGGMPVLSGAGGMPAADGGTAGMLAVAGMSMGGVGMGGTAGAGTAGASAGAAGCSNTQNDAQNCGACGVVCHVGRMCLSGACQAGWVPVKATSVSPRTRAAAVAMDKRVFIWGGLDDQGNALADGGIYDPQFDSWKVLPKVPGSPSARITASAVWTGTVVVVFGGTDSAAQNVYRDGGIYDPVANAWSVLPAPMTISRRNAPLAYWDGTRAVFWGGTALNGAAVPGVDRFDLSAWTTAAGGGDPGALLYPAFGVAGPVMYLQGGQLNGTRQDKGFAYNSSLDKWSTLPKSNLTPRSSAFGVWDNPRFMVWGGRDDNGLRNDGKYLDGTTWTAISGANAPTPRMIAFRRSGWSFQVSPGRFAVIGGQSSSAATLSTDGGIYTIATSQWSAISPWSVDDLHEYGMGVWTGEEFVLWGGRDANGSTATGQRWAP